MPKNEITKTQTNEVAQVGKSSIQIQTELLNELDKANQDFGVGFTEYGKTCAVNCIAGVFAYCKANSIQFNQLDGSLLKLQIQNVGFTELNYASIPSEIYFDFRKVKGKDKDGNEVDKYLVAIKPQGAGNEKLVRTYGVGIKPKTGLHSAILIREGDEYELPQFDGLNITPFKYKPKLENMNNKVIAVCYPVEKIDGSVEYLFATRESVKANLIAQIRQNSLYNEDFYDKEKYTAKNGKEYEKRTLNKEKRNEFYAHIEKLTENMSVDQMLENEELLEYINPTYTSGGSKEAMILRKMKNNALKQYPKEYNNSMVADSVRNMFEENDPSVLEKKKDVVKKVEQEIEEDNEDEVMDFSTSENDQPQNNEGDSDIPF